MEHHDPAVKLSELPDQPTYNVKAVCMRTGITGATLRAWERRYGLPAPNRSAQGYRLYSERDVAILHWLMQETIRGIHIGHAVQQLTNRLASGQDITIVLPSQPALRGDSVPRAPEVIATELADAYRDLSEPQCNELLTEAIALYTLETVIFSILHRALSIIHDDIRQATASATLENFAVNHMRHRLERLLHTTPLKHPNRSAVLIGFANEACELDLLMLTVLLRRAGHEVSYVVADFDAALLRTELRGLRTNLIMVYVHSPENAFHLVELQRDTERPLIPMLYAGHAPLHKSDLRDILPLEYIGDDLRLIYHELLIRLRHIATLVPDKT